MKQQLIMIAAAGMLLLGLGMANAASENDIRSQDAMGPGMSGCVDGQTLCLDRDMTTEITPLSQSDAEVGLRLAPPDDSINESVEEEEASDTDETAVEENGKPDILIIVR
jgi:hypothetical protein